MTAVPGLRAAVIAAAMGVIENLEGDGIINSPYEI
jgi:hypothetical protein